MRVVLDTNLIVRAAGARAGFGLDLVLLSIGEPHVLLSLGPITRTLFAPEILRFAASHNIRILRDTDLIAELRGD